MMNEDEIKDDLQKSRKWIDSKEAVVIKAFLEKSFSGDVQVFVLNHHFGQAEEYFTLMVNAEFIVDIEYARNKIIEHDIYHLDAYMAENKKMPKTFKRTIDLAKQLSG